MTIDVLYSCIVNFSFVLLKNFYKSSREASVIAVAQIFNNFFLLLLNFEVATCLDIMEYYSILDKFSFNGMLPVTADYFI